MGNKFIQSITVLNENDKVMEGETLTYRVEMKGAYNSDTILKFSLKGRASLEKDFNELLFTNGVVANGDGTLTVPAGVENFEINVETVNDSHFEKSEGLVVKLDGLQAKAKIIDAVKVEDISVANLDGKVIEGEIMVFNVRLSNSTGSSVTMKLNLKGRASEQDFDALVFSEGVINNNDGTITIPAGVEQFDINVPTIQDGNFESKEGVVISLGGVRAKGKIVDALTIEDISVANQNGKVVEGDLMTFNVSINNASAESVTMKLTLKGQATKGVDRDFGDLEFTNGVIGNSDGTITIPPGIESFDINVPTFNDKNAEGTERLVVKLGNQKAVGKILNVEAEPELEIYAINGKLSATEGEMLSFQVSFVRPIDVDQSLSISISGDATENIDYSAFTFSHGVIYDAAIGELIIGAGVSDFTISIPTIDDNIDEANESLTLEIGGVHTTAVILDNDFASEVTEITVANQGDSAEEGKLLSFEVSLNQASDTQQNFAMSISGTAGVGGENTDYSEFIFSNGVLYDTDTEELIVPAGVIEFVITVPTIDDIIIETSETLILNIDDIQATAIITDNDFYTPGKVTNSITGGASVEEGGSLSFLFTLGQSKVVEQNLTISLLGTATEHTDYSGLTFSNGVIYDTGLGELLVPANVSEFTILIPTIDDSLDEPIESLVLEIDGMQAIGEITDNDDIKGVIDITVVNEDASVEEGKSLSFQVTLSQASDTEQSFAMSINGTAVENINYSGFIFSNGVIYNTVMGEVIVPVGVSKFTVSIPTIDDSIVETSETLILNIDGMQATAEIIDNDDAKAVVDIKVANDDASVNEGGSLTFQVSLSHASEIEQSFAMSILGTATANTDYSDLIFSNGIIYDAGIEELIVPSGVSEFTVLIPIIYDSSVEEDETLSLVIDGVQATAVIIDNDDHDITATASKDPLDVMEGFVRAEDLNSIIEASVDHDEPDDLELFDDPEVLNSDDLVDSDSEVTIIDWDEEGLVTIICEYPINPDPYFGFGPDDKDLSLADVLEQGLFFTFGMSMTENGEFMCGSLGSGLIETAEFDAQVNYEQGDLSLINENIIYIDEV